MRLNFELIRNNLLVNLYFTQRRPILDQAIFNNVGLRFIYSILNT